VQKVDEKLVKEGQSQDARVNKEKYCQRYWRCLVVYSIRGLANSKSWFSPLAGKQHKEEDKRLKN